MSMETLRIEGIATPVSRIGLGTWAIGGAMWGGADDANSVSTIRKAIDAGVNQIDTAPAYGFGHSEQVVGKTLVGIRDRAVIATQVALEWPEGKVRRNATAASLRTTCSSAPSSTTCCRTRGRPACETQIRQVAAYLSALAPAQ